MPDAASLLKCPCYIDVMNIVEWKFVFVTKREVNYGNKLGLDMDSMFGKSSLICGRPYGLDNMYPKCICLGA